MLQRMPPRAGIAADELQRAEAYASAALSGASCKSEAGLKLLGDIKLAAYAAGSSPAQSFESQSPSELLEAFFSR